MQFLGKELSVVIIDSTENIDKMRYLAVLLIVGIVCQVSYSQKFRKIGRKYYYIENHDKLDWFDAREECRGMDAHLVSIQNEREWDSLYDVLCEWKSYWVDIRSDDYSNNWTSDTSGSDAPYLRWNPGHPRLRYDYDCVKLSRYTHNMKTRYCSQLNHYICEANRYPVTSTPPPIVHHPTSGYEIVDMKL